MKIVKLKKNNLKKIIKLAKKNLENEDLVVIPSDTVYGLAANAQSKKAVQKVLDFKGRRPDKGISIFLKNFGEIKKYAYCDSNQERILKTMLPGSFTVILKSRHQTMPELEVKDGTIGLRLIDHPFVGQLVKALSFPITATSVNISGKRPHYSIDALLGTLSEKKKKMLGLVVDAGKLPANPPSTVMRLVEDEVEVLRKGVLNPRLVARYETSGEKETKKTAQKLYHSVFKKHLKNKVVVVILKGDLGSGKTVFAKGIGELFGQQFSSPTFILMDEYVINRPPLRKIYHLDLFRLEAEEEILGLQLEKFLEKGNLLLIEWGEKLSVFQSLKKKNTAFFWLEIEEKGRKKRRLNLYRL